LKLTRDSVGYSVRRGCHDSDSRQQGINAIGRNLSRQYITYRVIGQTSVMPKWRGSVTGYPFLRMTENSGPASRTANYCAARTVCAMCSDHSTAILNSSRT
jgi:hypothetical protein